MMKILVNRLFRLTLLFQMFGHLILVLPIRFRSRRRSEGQRLTGVTVRARLLPPFVIMITFSLLPIVLIRITFIIKVSLFRLLIVKIVMFRVRLMIPVTLKKTLSLLLLLTRLILALTRLRRLIRRLLSWLPFVLSLIRRPAVVSVRVQIRPVLASLKNILRRPIRVVVYLRPLGHGSIR